MTKVNRYIGTLLKFQASSKQAILACCCVYVMCLVLILSTQNVIAAQMAVVKSRPVIVWGVNSGPPFHIFTGPYQQQGICDVLINAVHRQLPQYRKKIVVMPQPRISEALKDREQLCFPCMIHPMQASDRASFSLPTHSYRPHQIITTKKIAMQMQQRYPLPIPLELLLNDPDFQFGYPKGRRFGSLQPLIERSAVNRPPFTRSGDEGVAAILDMIIAGRLDYTLDYAMASHYGELLHPNVEFVLLPIAENQHKVVFGGIGCGTNAWSALLISDINKKIDNIRQDPEFLKVLKKWQEAKDPDYLYFNNQQLQQAQPKD